MGIVESCNRSVKIGMSRDPKEQKGHNTAVSSGAQMHRSQTSQCSTSMCNFAGQLESQEQPTPKLKYTNSNGSHQSGKIKNGLEC